MPRGGAFGIAILASALAWGIEALAPRTHAPPILAGVLVAVVFIGAGFAIGFFGRLDPRSAALPIALAALLYVGATFAVASRAPARSASAAPPALVLSAAIAVLGMIAGVSGGHRRRVEKER